MSKSISTYYNIFDLGLFGSICVLTLQKGIVSVGSYMKHCRPINMDIKIGIPSADKISFFQIALTLSLCMVLEMNLNLNTHIFHLNVTGLLVYIYVLLSSFLKLYCKFFDKNIFLQILLIDKRSVFLNRST